MKCILSAPGLAGRVVSIAAVFVMVAVPARADLTLTLKDGRVTLVADNVTPRQILAEWARLGQVRVVNGDKIPGAPVTLRLNDVSERQALDIILRAAAGYMAAPREEYLAQGSIYDRIVVLPTSTAIAPTGLSAGPTRPTPVMPMAPSADMQQGNVEDGEEFQAQPAGQPFNPYVNTGVPPKPTDPPYPAQGGPYPTTFPGSVTMPQVQPVQPALPQAVPNSPAGAARPGQITPVPQVPPTTYADPYNMGAPATGTAVDPDRLKYTNPYQPTPVPPVRPPSD